MKRSAHSLLGLLCLLSASGSSSCKAPGGAPSSGGSVREIEDLAGRRVIVPRAPKRVLAFGHSFAIMVALAPDLLVARPGPFKANPQAAPFLPPGIANLPQLSVGHDVDPEAVKSLHFDLAVGWNTAAFQREQMRLLAQISVPALLVGVDRLDQYPATFRLLGKVLGRESRAEELARYLEAKLERMQLRISKIPETERPRVYYAEAMDGLTSQCGLEGRAEVLRLAGARNVLSCEGILQSLSPPDVESHNAPIDLESLIVLAPDVIVTRFDKTAELIRSDARWQRLRAVREGRVYAIPQLPFNWFDRPPSFMRAMGMQWLARHLHPQRIDMDLRQETLRFYSLFFGVSPSPGELDLLLGPGVP